MACRYFPHNQTKAPLRFPSVTCHKAFTMSTLSTEKRCCADRWSLRTRDSVGTKKSVEQKFSPFLLAIDGRNWNSAFDLPPIFNSPKTFQGCGLEPNDARLCLIVKPFVNIELPIKLVLQLMIEGIMKTSPVFLLITLILSIGIKGCTTPLDSREREKTLVCGVSNPINELSWLKGQYEAIKNVPQSGIILYSYNSKDVIEIQSPLMNSTNLSQYYCDGTQLQFDSAQTYNDYKDFLGKRVKTQILYGIDLWKL